MNQVVKVTLDITNPELDAWEDLLFAWNLCPKHNGARKATPDDYWRWTQTCPACQKINENLKKKANKLWVKLVTAYDNTKAK